MRPGPAPTVVTLDEAGAALTTTGSSRDRLARAGLVVAPATLLANVLGYAFSVVGARGLGPADFGVLGALLGLVLVGSVPGLALQAVVARRVAVAGRGGHQDTVAGLLPVVVVVAVATGAVTAALAPLLGAYLRTGPAGVLWLAASLVPVTVVSAQQGALQGQELFSRLAVLFVAAAGLRLLGGGLAVAVGGGPAAVLAGTAVGSALAVAVGTRLLPVRTRHRAGTPRQGVPRELVTVVVGLLAFVLVSNLDVILARRYLDATQAGVYAVGSVFTKGALWAPQAVVVLVFPRLSRAGAGRVLLAATAGVAAFGAVLVGAVALLGGPVVRLVFGSSYADLAGRAWWFTALGALLALGQLLVFSGFARQRSSLPFAVGLVAAVELAVVTLWRHDTLDQVLLTAVCAAAAVVVLGAVVAARRSAPS